MFRDSLLWVSGCLAMFASCTLALKSCDEGDDRQLLYQKLSAGTSFPFHFLSDPPRSLRSVSSIGYWASLPAGRLAGADADAPPAYPTEVRAKLYVARVWQLGDGSSALFDLHFFRFWRDSRLDLNCSHPTLFLTSVSTAPGNSGDDPCCCRQKERRAVWMPSLTIANLGIVNNKAVADIDSFAVLTSTTPHRRPCQSTPLTNFRRPCDACETTSGSTAVPGLPLHFPF